MQYGFLEAEALAAKYRVKLRLEKGKLVESGTRNMMGANSTYNFTEVWVNKKPILYWSGPNKYALRELLRELSKDL
jgi:hypothetical protein